MGLVTIDLLFPQAKDILDIGVLVAAPEAHLRTRKAQKATKGGKGQKSTKSPKAAPPTAAPTPAPTCGTALSGLLGIQSADTLEALLFDEEVFFPTFSSQFPYSFWEFNELETCGEYTISKPDSNVYLNGGSILPGSNVGQVIYSMGGVLPHPSELVWVVEEVANPKFGLKRYSIKSKASGGYLDNLESKSQARACVKNDPNGPGLVNYQWFLFR